MKYLACDLDGTLLNRDHTISEANLEAIKTFKDAGNKFIISTGRDLESIYNLLKRYPEVEWDYIVACNGSIILNKHNEVIVNEVMDSKIVKEIILEHKDNEDIFMHFQAEGKHYLIKSKSLENFDALDKEIKQVANTFKNKITVEELIDNEMEYSFLSFFCKNKDISVIEDIKNSIINKYGKSIEAFRNLFFIDMAPKNCSKGNGLRNILSLDDVTEEKLYAIGDSFNDLSMFELTRNSFTFHHVEEDIKNIANNHVSDVSECIYKIMN